MHCSRSVLPFSNLNGKRDCCRMACRACICMHTKMENLQSVFWSMEVHVSDLPTCPVPFWGGQKGTGRAERDNRNIDYTLNIWHSQNNYNPRGQGDTLLRLGLEPYGQYYSQEGHLLGQRITVARCSGILCGNWCWRMKQIEPHESLSLFSFFF